GRDEHGLEPLEVFPGVKVALDVRLDPDQPLEDFLGSQVIHDSGVEPLELIDENGIEDRARHPAPQVHGLLGREVGPAGVDRVADEGFLNRTLFAAEGGGDNAGRVIRRLGSGSGSRLSFDLSPPCPQRSRPRALGVGGPFFLRRHPFRGFEQLRLNFSLESQGVDGGLFRAFVFKRPGSASAWQWSPPDTHNFRSLYCTLVPSPIPRYDDGPRRGVRRRGRSSRSPRAWRRALSWGRRLWPQGRRPSALSPVHRERRTPRRTQVNPRALDGQIRALRTPRLPGHCWSAMSWKPRCPKRPNLS